MELELEHPPLFLHQELVTGSSKHRPSDPLVKSSFVEPVNPRNDSVSCWPFIGWFQ
jgi:hypothetical protein